MTGILNRNSSEIAHFFLHDVRRVPKPWDVFIRYDSIAVLFFSKSFFGLIRRTCLNLPN